ncbi:multicopper oxidase family protein [Paenibacillus sp. PDC88]|uniref:Multicopper oxidase family protein n=2 Tax=Bacillati TaxID=1783272 RepID=A0ABW3PXE4_9BACL
MEGMDHSTMNSNTPTTTNTIDKNSIKLTSATPVINGKEFTITAQESNLEVTPGQVLPVWTFNNSVPGPQIRVKVGDIVKVNLKNELKEPVSIHWHGYPVPNDMDGIPGVTQDAVVPGKTFAYEFEATIPGTYWYHSHQDSVNQLDKGLYGSLIVEDPDEKYNKDFTLMLDEWMSSGEMDTSNQKSNNLDNKIQIEGMDHSNMNMDDMDMDGMDMAAHDMSMYDIYTINGKSGDSIDKLTVNEGDKVRIRLVNAGYISHKMHLHGHDFKVISSDGQPINDPEVIKDQLISIAPGERYDIEFTANNPGSWLLEEHGDKSKNMKTVIQYDGSDTQKDNSNSSEDLRVFDLAQYGVLVNSNFSLDETTFDQEINMELNTEMRNGEMVYTINGKVYPDTEKLNVKKGDKVKVTFVNRSETDDHPMHLHGHFFQLLSKNGMPIKGSPIMKDTINVKPGEEYVIAFEADNPGEWMFHCHDLHHASSGMVTEVQYSDYQTNYTPDLSIENKAE